LQKRCEFERMIGTGESWLDDLFFAVKPAPAVFSEICPSDLLGFIKTSNFQEYQSAPPGAPQTSFFLPEEPTLSAPVEISRSAHAPASELATLAELRRRTQELRNSLPRQKKVKKIRQEISRSAVDLPPLPSRVPKPGILEYRKFLEEQISEKKVAREKLKSAESAGAAAEAARLAGEEILLEKEKRKLLEIENLEIQRIGWGFRRRENSRRLKSLFLIEDRDSRIQFRKFQAGLVLPPAPGNFFGPGNFNRKFGPLAHQTSDLEISRSILQRLWSKQETAEISHHPETCSDLAASQNLEIYSLKSRVDPSTLPAAGFRAEKVAEIPKEILTEISSETEASSEAEEPEILPAVTNVWLPLQICLQRRDRIPKIREEKRLGKILRNYLSAEEVVLKLKTQQAIFLGKNLEISEKFCLSLEVFCQGGSVKDLEISFQRIAEEEASNFQVSRTSRSATNFREILQSFEIEALPVDKDFIFSVFFNDPEISRKYSSIWRLSLLTVFARHSSTKVWLDHRKKPGNFFRRVHRFISVWSDFCFLHALETEESKFRKNLENSLSVFEMRNFQVIFLEACHRRLFLSSPADAPALEAVQVMLVSAVDLCFSEGREEEISRSFEKGERVLVKYLRRVRLQDESEGQLQLLLDFSDYYT